MALYTIEPSAECRTVGSLALKNQDAGAIPAELAQLAVERVEVCTKTQTLRVYLSGDRAIADSGHRQLVVWFRERVAEICRREGFAPEVAPQVDVVIDSDQDTTSDQKQAQSQSISPEPQSPYLTVDEDDYMNLVVSHADHLRNGQAASTASNGQASKGKPRKGSALLGRGIADTPVSIATIDDEERSIVIQGEVIKIDVRETRAGRYIISFIVSDWQDSIEVKVFSEDSQLADALRSGMWVKVRGGVQLDRFSQELTVLARDIVEVDKPVRVDGAPEKRVELHLHTKMSAMDATVNVAEAIKIAASWGHPAIAITDHGVVQAYPDAWAAGKKHGIKVIYGLEGYLIDGDDPKARSYHIVILAKNYTGLKNLYRLVSLSHLQYFYRRPKLPREEIIKHREGLIIGSACESGELFRALLDNADETKLSQIASFYDYLEIQPLSNNQFLIGTAVESREDLKNLNRRIVELGQKLGKPVVATGDVHFLEPQDEVYRRILMAGQGYSDADNQPELYFRTTEEMLDEFSYLGEDRAKWVVVDAPRQISDQIEEMQPVPDGLHAPVLEGAEEKVKEMTYSQARQIYGEELPEIVAKRLDKELSSILGHGFAVLYYIAHKLVKKSLSDGYLVGSRGSVGSSLVATMCQITEVNPLPPHYVCPECKFSEFITDGSWATGPDLPDRDCPRCGQPLNKDGFDIPFEVFLGFHGDKVPDIDLNFSGEYQPTVHKYCEELFGREYVYRAGTIGTLADKTAYGFVRKYFESKGQRIRSAEVERLVQGCTGVRRTTGQHPGGMMVVPSDRDIFEFTPIQYPANDPSSGVITTHFDYNAIQDQLVKLDILGHDDPTSLRMLQDLTGVDVRKIPLDDPKTMALFSNTESLQVSPEDIGTSVGSLGIPEFGTGFVRRMLEEIRPTTFGELVRISGFSHGTNV